MEFSAKFCVSISVKLCCLGEIKIDINGTMRVLSCKMKVNSSSDNHTELLRNIWVILNYYYLETIIKEISFIMFVFKMLGETIEILNRSGYFGNWPNLV